jgi:DNA-binding transcriptional regulator GbsR (MarR family)
MSLDNEDKQFIREVVHEIVHREIDEDKQFIREVVQEIVHREIDASEARMREYVYGTETRLLTEFHKWASPLEARVRSHTAILRALDMEQENLADRVKKLEDQK